jgi:hypothetical protein
VRPIIPFFLVTLTLLFISISLSMAWTDVVVAHTTKILSASWNSFITAFLDHSARHEAGGDDAIKLDDLAAPDANTDLNVSITKHGLCPVLPNSATVFLNGVGGYTVPTGTGDVAGPASATISNLAGFTDATGKVLKDSGIAAATVVVTSDARLTDNRHPTAHASHHENGGDDEMSVLGLSGLLADGQTPLTHNQAGETITSGTIDGDRLPAISTTKKGAVPATGTPSGKYLKDDGTWAASAIDPGAVQGPASATDTAIAIFDTGTGKIVKNSLAKVNATGAIDIPTGQTFTVNGSQHVHAEADVTGLATDLSERIPHIVLYPVGAIVPAANPTFAEGTYAVNNASLSNGIDYVYGAFPDALANYLLWTQDLPAAWASSTFTVQFNLITNSASIGTMKMVLEAIRCPAGSMNLAPTTFTNATVSNTGADQLIISTESTAAAISGTGNKVFFKLSRDYANDTLAGEARILSIRITPVI